MFLNAEPCADIAILHPLADLWMKFGPQRDPFPVVSYPEYQHNVWEAVQQNGRVGHSVAGISKVFPSRANSVLGKTACASARILAARSCG